MRKHFLILMLMALLPLAGWAEDITANHVTVVNPYYGNLPTFAGSFANAVVVEGYYADANATTPKTPADVKAAVGGKKFYVKFSATGLDGTLTQPFTVEKMPLKLYGTPGTKMYGIESDGDIFKFTATGAKIETKYPVGTNVATLTNDLKNQIDFSRDPGDNVKTYAIHAAIKSTSDYYNKYVINDADILTLDATPVVAKYSITAKTFTDGTDGTVTIDVVADLTYNGKAQKANVTVTDKAKKAKLTEAQYQADGTTPKAGTGDYYLVWDANTNAGTNTAKVTVKGMGNYAVGEIAAKTFTINPAPLWAIPVAEKEYNGNADVPAAPADLTNTKVYYDFQGFVDTKKAKDVEISTDNAKKATWASADAKKNVGEYKLNFTNADINTAFTLANYKFVAVEGTFKITQKKVTAKAADVTIAYGDPEVFTIQDDANFDSWKDAVAGDVPALGYATKITKSAQPVGGTGEHKNDYVLTPSFKTAEEIDADADGAITKAVNAAVDANTSIAEADKPAAKIAQLAAAKVAAKEVIKNYILNEVTQTTPASTYVGYLTQTKSPLQIGLKQSAYKLTKVYDGQNVSFTLDKENGVTVIGAKNNEKIDLTNLVYEIEANDSKVGLYTIRLSGVKNDNYAISYIPSQFEITKRPIRLSIAAQTFQTTKVPTIAQNYSFETIEGVDADEQGVADNDKVADVFKLGFAPMVYNFESYSESENGTHYANGTAKVVSIDATAHKTTIEVLTNVPFGDNCTVEDANSFVGKRFTVPSDDLNVDGRLKLTDVDANAEIDVWVDPTTLASGVKVAADGKIADAAGTEIANGIIAVDPKTKGSVFANYEFSYTQGSGKVNIIAATDKVLNEKTDLTTLAASSAAENVRLESDRQIKKNVWASMVLPFNTTVRAVSEALGYAVVDMFVEDPNSDAMNFKLHMGAIPAYTPFLVKTDETINLNTVVFEDVKIVKLTDANRGNLTQSNKSYNFVGNMKYGEVGVDFWSDGSKMTEESIEFNKYRSTANCRAMKAYITAKAGVTAAPAIFIEEPDGTTTAINGVVAEKVSTVKEGWYTLNGVKLQGVPTQKGIYINNGKKVVIK